MTAYRHDLATLFSRWESQQELYIPAREDRYRLMIDLVRANKARADVARGTDPRRPLRLLDLACGPGSASRRLRAAFPEASIVALDIDPVLLRLGADAWPAESVAPQWVDADLRAERWPDLVAGQGPFDAIVSTTALHWLRPAELGRVYAHAFTALRPGGMLLNGDFVPDPETTDAAGVTLTLLGEVEQFRIDRARSQGALEWDAWWSQVEDSGTYAAELAERTRRFSLTERAPEPTLADHLATMSAAGFVDPSVVWRDLHEVLLVATRAAR